MGSQKTKLETSSEMHFATESAKPVSDFFWACTGFFY